MVEVTTEMAAYQLVSNTASHRILTIGRNEIFGPVLSVICAETLDEAIDIINANK
jgi:acyl-CoA reductase-like NAD-dependent aldehyde dehydrogenase